MIRKLVDYKKLNHELVAKLIESYPDGYGDEDIIIFKNLKGEIIETVELKTDDTIYLVKITKSLANFISNFEENMEKELDSTIENLDQKEINQQLDFASESETSE